MICFRHLIGVTAALLIAGPVLAQNQSFNDVVKKVEARVEPAAAKRGQTVKWTLIVELADGWHTYPSKQADPRADSYLNRFKFPSENGIVFVGELVEPKTVEKVEDGVKVAMVEGKGTWQRALVVRPDARPGKVTIKVPVRMLACADRCLPPQTVNTEVELTITEAAPVAVDPKYQKDLDAAKK